MCEAIGLPKQENGFAAVSALAEKTGVRVPAGLKDLEKKEIRHKSVIDIADMPSAVYDAVR